MESARAMSLGGVGVNEGLSTIADVAMDSGTQVASYGPNVEHLVGASSGRSVVDAGMTMVTSLGEEEVVEAGEATREAKVVVDFFRDSLKSLMESFICCTI